MAPRSYFESTKHIDIKLFGSSGVLSYAGEDFGTALQNFGVHRATEPGKKEHRWLKVPFLMFGAEDQHPESGELRLERYDGTEVHLPGPAVSAFASFATLTFLQLSLFLC